ncbi:hypothetical protein B1L11_08895 [Microbispora sp. GKU 823]|nr:hypothetical protein B1L11_08895 [Microbispora sp. GKU 823]
MGSRLEIGGTDLGRNRLNYLVVASALSLAACPGRCSVARRQIRSLQDSCWSGTGWPSRLTRRSRTSVAAAWSGIALIAVLRSVALRRTRSTRWAWVVEMIKESMAVLSMAWRLSIVVGGPVSTLRAAVARMGSLSARWLRVQSTAERACAGSAVVSVMASAAVSRLR